MPSALAVAPAANVSVAALLAGWDDDDLLYLLERRPDLAAPAPRSFADLAARMVAPASAEAAFRRLDRAAQQVLEAMVVLSRPAGADEVASLLAPGVDSVDVDGPLRRLERVALVFGPHERLVVNPGLAGVRRRSALGPSLAMAMAGRTGSQLAAMCGRLGQKAGNTKAASLATLTACLSDPAVVARLLLEGPAGTAELARQAATGSEVAVQGGLYNLTDRSPAGWLTNRGLLVSIDWYRLVMPAEVSLSVRGGHLWPSFSAEAPVVASEPVEAAAVDAAGAERAGDCVSGLTRLLEEWAVRPGKRLKDGGAGVRDVRRAAATLGCSDRDAARLLDVAVGAGLLWADAGAEAVLPTAAFDDWARRPPAERWAILVAGWLACEFSPSVAGAMDGKDKPIPPVLLRHEAGAAHQRRDVLDALAQVPAGRAAERPSLVARAVWSAPDLWDSGPASARVLAGWALDECELLGLTARGALTSAGRAIVRGDVDGAAAGLAGHLPPVVSSFLLQADLTAVAAGSLSPEVAHELELMADVESRGAATVYRFGEQSLRRAFDAGRSAADVAAFLESHSERGVPQALAYLVADIGRRYGRVRVGSAGCYVRSDDAALVAEVARAKAVSKLKLRILAPTVLVSSADPATVLTSLRAAGYLPAGEDEQGALTVARPPSRRAAPRPRRPTATTASQGGLRPPADLDAVIAALRKARSPAPMQASSPARKAPAVMSPALFAAECERPTQIVRQRDDVWAVLEHARDHDWGVRVSYTNSKGRSSQLNVLVLGVTASKAEVETLPGGGVRALNLGRVEWARVLTEAEEEHLL